MSKEARKHHVTEEQRTAAVARVLAGESRRKVAKDMGIAQSTVSGWVKAAQSAETERFRKMGEKAEGIAEQIENLQETARLMLLERVVELVPSTDGLKDVMWSYGVATDKSRLGKGQPTSITKSVDQMDSEIEQMLATMAEREKSGSRNGSG